MLVTVYYRRAFLDFPISRLDSPDRSWTMIWWATLERIWKRSESNYRSCRRRSAQIQIDSRRRRMRWFSIYLSIVFISSRTRLAARRCGHALWCQKCDTLEAPVVSFTYLDLVPQYAAEWAMISTAHDRW